MHPKGSNTRVLVGGPHAPIYICALWKFITFLESWIVIFFLHKTFLALESFLHGPVRLWSFCFEKSSRFLKKLLIFGATYNLQTPYTEWTLHHFFLEILLFSHSYQHFERKCDPKSKFVSSICLFPKFPKATILQLFVRNTSQPHVQTAKWCTVAQFYVHACKWKESSSILAEPHRHKCI